MEAQEFGARLRQLRKQVGMTQRELADKVGIDFTYLSKLENGVIPPPSEKVILQLAETLNANKDELLSLAGRIPSDISQLLTNREALRFLRSVQRGHQILGTSNEKRRSLQKSGRSFLKKHRNFSRVAVAVALVVAVAAGMWFASPVKAVDVSLSNFPATMYTNSLHTFYAQVDINTNESIPATSLRLDITGPTPAFVVFNLDGTITSQSGHFANITPVVTPYYGYGYRYGYGYGYQPPPTGYRYFTHWWGYGYGYGYGYGVSGTTQLKYLVTLNTTGMALGSYQARLILNVDPAPKTFLSPTYSFTLTMPPSGVEAQPTAVSGTGSIDLTLYLDEEGKTTVEISLSSPDGLVTIVIPIGTQMLDPAGNPVGSVYVIVLNTPPPPPGYALVGPAYDCGPDGTTFAPPITLTFTYNPADIPDGTSEADLAMAYWDGNEWVFLSATVDTVANTVTAEVAHFTPFGILAKLPAPAAFAASDLSITPAEVDIGESVTISVLITNSGELTGSYAATLKIDNITVATKTVTLAGSASQKVTFTTVRNTAGTYTINVDGLSGTFTVKAPPEVPPEVPPTPAAFAASALTISPAEVDIGESVTISVLITNTGDLTGSYEATLKIDNVVVATKDVTLAGGASHKVTFTTSRNVAGIYTVTVDGLSDTFTVKAPPAPPPVAPPVAPPVPPTPINWWLIGGIIAAVVAVGVVIALVIRRHRRRV